LTVPQRDEILSHEEPVMFGRRILVVDDHEMVLVGLRTLLVNEPWVSRCLGAGSLDRALELTRQYEPHAALIDLFVGEESGNDYCRALRQARPSMRIVLMSGTGTIYPAVARAAGASGFVAKSWPTATMLEAVRRVCEGGCAFATRPAAIPETMLTPREQDVLRHVVLGSSNVEIAQALYLSRHTVKQHTSALYRKLGVRNRAEAASRAQQLGIVA
jgi:DNA-binding NarL/FixJ family response regulator